MDILRKLMEMSGKVKLKDKADKHERTAILQLLADKDINAMFSKSYDSLNLDKEDVKSAKEILSKAGFVNESADVQIDEDEVQIYMSRLYKNLSTLSKYNFDVDKLIKAAYKSTDKFEVEFSETSIEKDGNIIIDADIVYSDETGNGITVTIVNGKVKAR